MMLIDIVKCRGCGAGIFEFEGCINCPGGIPGPESNCRNWEGVNPRPVRVERGSRKTRKYREGLSSSVDIRYFLGSTNNTQSGQSVQPSLVGGTSTDTNKAPKSK